MENLGEAMNVKQVAALIGCSAWTVRQKHLPRGLPCFRSGPSGRLTFYKNQVVAWILERQKEQQGGRIL
jgi:phage terminase Nu1 subunit (DNA packaging protein)